MSHCNLYSVVAAVCLLSLHYNAVPADETEDEQTLRRLYDTIFATLSSAEYDRRIRPFLGVNPVQVTVFMRVLSLRSVSEATMDYRLELFFREKWMDPRLAYNVAAYGNITEISLHESLTNKIWIPDTFIPNAVKSRNPNKDSVTHRSLLRLYPDGSILYSRRLSVTAECPMDLTLYPFDFQVCILSIESYGHAVEALIYDWRELEPVITDTVELPDYQLTRIVTRSHNVTVATGTYSRLECCFFFKRSAAFYFVQLFLPATAIVFTSWILLCMGKDSNFSDMIAIILAITFLYFSYTAMMPRVSYVKAMDVYLGGCFLHVFISMAKMAATKYYETNFLEPEAKESEEEAVAESEKSKNQLTTAIEDAYIADSPSSERRFRYVPTNSAINVVENVPIRNDENRKKVSKLKGNCSRLLVRCISRVPNNAVLYSFLFFWVAYLVACLWLATDTNEDRCNF